MGSRIVRLHAALVNQIAAGEVIERPASVVKELLENAIDAGSKRVRVEVDSGGIARVMVADDGEGMSPEDATLALERHATSKIATFDDLLSLRSFGFRGEALPSIASISRLVLRTRTRDAREGVVVTVLGGGETVKSPAGSAPGTTIEVKDLFFNVPARRKFLKSTATESAHVSDVVVFAALARPEIAFTLVRDGRVAREFPPAASRDERARVVFPNDELARCDGQEERVGVSAFLGAPERARAGAHGLHLVVNGRPVRDHRLARAVAQAYGSVLEPGRYPLGVVYIDLPTEEVDVNVHPQKAEVRFARGRALYDLVTAQLHDALRKVFTIPSGPGNRPWLAPRPGGASFPPSHHPDDRLAEPSPSTPSPWSDLFVPFESLPLGSQPVSEPLPLEPEVGFYGRLAFVAQVRRMFLLCEGHDGLYVLDQHAAAERAAYSDLKRRFASRTIASQALLVPEVVELPERDVVLLEEAHEQILGLGVDVRPAGPRAAAIHAVPAILAGRDPRLLVRDVLDELGAGGRAFSAMTDRVLATMACHGSIRAGDAVSRAQADGLLTSLDGVDFSGHCPHGRPIVFRIPWAELERKVGR